MAKTLLSDLIQKQAAKYQQEAALKYRNYEQNAWVSISWLEFADIVNKTSNALIHYGVGIQENLGVFSQNKPECYYVDFGAFGVRAVTIPFYATSSEAQVHYMLEDASIRYLFVGEQQQYDVAFRVLALGTKLEKIIIFDKNVKRDPRDTISEYFIDFLREGNKESHEQEVKSRTSASTPDDLANILYTSGTTGVSKGVTLHHSCIEGAIEGHNQRFPELGHSDLVMNFLPLTHVFERAWSMWCLSRGCTMAVNLRPQDIQKTIKEVRPTCMCSVPRFWEKVYFGVQEKIEQTEGMAKAMMLNALKVGKEHNVEHVFKGKRPPLWLHLKYKFYEKTVYSLLKKTIGIDRGRFFPTAGAAIPQEVQEFAWSVGINMISGYGLTESTASVSTDLDTDHVVGSVGRIMPHVQVKIDPLNGEILIKGVGVTHGYYKKDAENQTAFTSDGWFRTGDIGYVKDNHLFLTDRLKDLFKTSNGKYIAPQAIESKMVVDKYIDQISIIADQRKFVSALIVPEYQLLQKYANDNGIAYASMADLVQNEQIIAMIKERIDTLQQQFAHFEQIKRFTLLPEPFSMAKGELTNTLKIKRSVLLVNYAEQISKMYEE